uniref:N-acetyllactosaminide beta-1,3-N-acetylglucosaminyltransferase n=1 Tax=Parastrongyloides trichosuri TaxID=131310 RepID=A0A0N4Z7M7_PARTI
MFKYKHAFNIKLLYWLCLYALVLIFIGYSYNITEFIIPKLNATLSDYDNNFTFTQYKEYTIFPSIIKGQNYKSSETIVLILHISIDQNLEKIRNHLINWEGFISLSVYINPEKHNFKLISCAYCKLKNIINGFKNIDIHFIIRNTELQNNFYINDFYLLQMNKYCDKTYINIDTTVCINNTYNIKEKAISMSNYPINILRNIARKFSYGKYIVIADMDHMFSKSFHNKMLDVGRKYLNNNSNNVLVYRIFEVKDENLANGPKNKKDLQQMIKDKSAFIFHHFYAGAHSISKLDEWFNVTESEDGYTSIQHEEPYTRFNWEPQFMSLATIPYHDERFTYPNRDNTCLRWQLCKEGYKFLVVNDVFMFHLGLKDKNESSAVGMAKRMTASTFSKAMEAFKKDMSTNQKNKTHCHF